MTQRVCAYCDRRAYMIVQGEARCDRHATAGSRGRLPRIDRLLGSVRKVRTALLQVRKG